MRTRWSSPAPASGFIQGWNAQAAADAGDQVLVAHGIGNTGSDQDQLVPMLGAIERGTGRLPDELSAHAGYCSEDNLKALDQPSGGWLLGKGSPERTAGKGKRQQTASRIVQEIRQSVHETVREGTCPPDRTKSGNYSGSLAIDAPAGADGNDKDDEGIVPDLAKQPVVPCPVTP